MPGAYRQVLTMNMEPPRPKKNLNTWTLSSRKTLGFSCELVYIDWDFDAGGIQTGFDYEHGTTTTKNKIWTLGIFLWISIHRLGFWCRGHTDRFSPCKPWTQSPKAPQHRMCSDFPGNGPYTWAAARLVNPTTGCSRNSERNLWEPLHTALISYT